MQPGAKSPAQVVRDGAARQRQVREAMAEAVKATPATPPRSTLEGEAVAQGETPAREGR